MSVLKKNAVYIGLLLQILAPSVNADQLRISGSVKPMLQHLRLIGPSKPEMKLSLSLTMKLRNQEKLDRLSQEIYDVNSHHYQRFLTPAEFNARFSPSNESTEIVKRFLLSQGMKITTIADHNKYIKVTGTVGQISKAFHVQLNDYHYQHKIVYANTKEPILAAEIKDYISSISGLNNISLPDQTPKRQTSAQHLPGPLKNLAPLCGLNATQQANLVNSSGQVIVPNMAFTGYTLCNGYTGEQLQTAYNSNTVPGLDGTGQTIVITVSCGSPTILTDANTYSEANGLPLLINNVNFKVQNSPGFTSCSPSDFALWSQPTTLYVEAAHTTAPNANIILAVTNNSIPDLHALVEYIVEQGPQGLGFPNAYIVSNSWGDTTPESMSSSLESTLQQAAVEGFSVNFDSGNFGDLTELRGYSRGVIYPGSSTWVTSVGGTSLFLDEQNNYLYETGWGTQVSPAPNYTCTQISGNRCTSYRANPIFEFYNFPSDPFGFGSTGGLSSFYPAQPNQQAAISQLFAGGYYIIGSQPKSINPFVTYRAVPDIAMDADVSTGLVIYYTVNGSVTSLTDGHTGMSNALFSGVLALVNQKRMGLGKPPLGLAAPYLYNLPTGALNTVNSLHGVGWPVLALDMSPNSFQLFQFDPVTGDLNGHVYNQDTSLTLGQPWNDISGVGTPNVPNFVDALANV